MTWQQTLTDLETGKVRAAEQSHSGTWQVNSAVKQAILMAFKAGKNTEFEGIYRGFVDKHNLPAREFTIDDNVRMVPGGSSVRRGAYVAPGVIIMPPAYINVGAFVDSGTMIDSHALIGSCAQIGKNVHVSAAVEKAADIPENAVVVPGTRPVVGDWAEQQGLNMACALIVKYRDEKSNAALALESVLR